MSKKSHTICSVPQCRSRRNKDISMHKFPKDENQQQRWAEALKLGKAVTSGLRVCGKHFLPSDFFPYRDPIQRKLKRNAVPSQCIPILLVDSSSPSQIKRPRRRTLALTLNVSSDTSEIPLPIPSIPVYVSHLTQNKGEPAQYSMSPTGTLGKALILYHETFCNPRQDRTSSQEDLNRLKDLLKALRFEVDIRQDLSINEIDDVLEYYSQKVNHTSYSCFIICVITQGDVEGNLKAKDGTYSIDKLLEPFSPEKCLRLAGKPKLYFIEASQSIPSRAETVKNKGQDNKSKETRLCIPKHSDFLVSLAAFPGSSEAMEHRGAWYIQELCQALEEFGTTWNLVDILTQVHQRVDSVEGFHPTKHITDAVGARAATLNITKEYMKQCCCFTSTLMGHVYF